MGMNSMKSKFISTALSLSLSILACLSTPNAQANSGYYLYANPHSRAELSYQDIDAFNSNLNSEYLNGAATLEEVVHKLKSGARLTNYIIELPGSEQRYGVFKLQKLNEDGSEVVDLVVGSPREAELVCNQLYRFGQGVLDPSQVHVDIKNPGIAHAYAKVIALKYEIDYDKNSKDDGKGNSTPGKKFFFCGNKWGWELDPNKGDEENLKTGIKKSTFRKPNYYDVTCMADNKNPTTFELVETNDDDGSTQWVNDRGRDYKVTPDPTEPNEPKAPPTEHQLNVQVGAEYCRPIS